MLLFFLNFHMHIVSRDRVLDSSSFDVEFGMRIKKSKLRMSSTGLISFCRDGETGSPSLLWTSDNEKFP